MIGLKQSKEFFYRGSSRFLCKKVLSFSAACARELPGCRSRIKSYDCEHGLKGRITREKKSCFLVSGRRLLITWFLWRGLEVCLPPGEKAVVLVKRFSSLQNKWRRQFFCFEPKGCLVGNKKRTAQRSSSDCYINCKPMKIGGAASP